MKQIVQNLSNGKTLMIDVPMPIAHTNTILVRNTVSAVSAGTERQMIDFAKRSLLGKALERPDLVRKVVAVAQTEGVAEAYQQAMGRLDTFRPLGYSSAGSVVDIGTGVSGIRVGDRLACSGSGFACHAEYVAVPQTLCAPIPDGVSDEDAAFAALGAIALHALRLAQLQLGDRVAVIGLGLLGLLAVQIAKAWGCQVLGTDVAANKADLARQLGADEAVAGGKEAVLAAAQALFSGAGADAVVIFASTPSNEPLELAAELARVRGRIVAPGLVGLNVPRRAFYEKEMDLKISRAWGPGLYDPDYEERGHDYPLPFVRWTAGRNMEAFLQLLAQGRVRVQPLITHRFPIERATEAYELITSGREPYIGVVLEYGLGKKGIREKGNDGKKEQGDQGDKEKRGQGNKGIGEQGEKGIREQGDKGREVEGEKGEEGEEDVRLSCQTKVWLKQPAANSTYSLILLSTYSLINVGLIGAGNFAKATLLPAIRRVKGVHLRGIATATGASARHTGDKFGFDYCTTDHHELLNDPDIDAIIIATRHNTHARFTAEALRAHKHVFVEKPLALNVEQLREVVEAYQENGRRKTEDGEWMMETQSPISDLRHPSSVVRRPSSVLQVGFNRRFSPFTLALKQWLSFTDLPMVINVRVNAGYVPPDRWEQDPEVGGGRIVGEVCHFVDLIQYLTDAYPVQVCAQAMRAAGQYLSEDNLAITLKMSDGSVGTIIYTASGDKAFPRERVEVFRGGAVGLIENFKAASFTHRGRTRRKRNLFGVDRGHRAEMEVFFSAIHNGGPPPVAFPEYVWTTLATFSIVESMQRGGAKQVEIPSVLTASSQPDAGGQ